MRSRPRRARKKDAAEGVIVEAVRKAGWLVYDELLCDLLAVKRLHWMHCASYRGEPCNCDRPPEVRLLEVKTPTKSGKRRKRNDQSTQDAFLESTGTHVVTTPEEALRALE